MRRAGWVLIGSGLLVLAFLGYQLFVTDLLNSRIQTEARAQLDEELAERRVELPAPEVVAEPPDDSDDAVADDADDSEQSTDAEQTGTETVDDDGAGSIGDPIVHVPEQAGEEGSTLGRLVIPAIDVDEVMFQGVERDTLKMGPGHMPSTPVPGQPGNAVLSGHRTTYGRPFYDLDQLEEGARIEVETAVGTHVYEVRRSLVVEPTDVWVTEEIPGAWLTLTTCHPHFSAAERLVVQAELVDGPNLEYAELLVENARDQEDPT